MEVDVHHHLVGVASVVLKDVVRGGSGGLHHRPAQPGKGAADGSCQSVAQFVEKCFPFLRNDQDVTAA